MAKLDFAQLAGVYEESLLQQAALDFRHCDEREGFLLARQDLYNYLSSCFYAREDAVIACWAPQGSYCAALRLEPYKDGVLLTALETSPQERGKGYATSLVLAVLDHLRTAGIRSVYSHIDKKNRSSLTVHNKCGFQRLLEHAVFLDGSVSHESATYCIRLI